MLEAEMMGKQAFMIGLAAQKMEKALGGFLKSNGDPRQTQMAADAGTNHFIRALKRMATLV